MSLSRFIPTSPHVLLRLFRFLFALITACVLGTSFRDDELWTTPIKRAGGFMMFTAIITILYDIYTFLFSVDAKIHDCTYSKRYKTVHCLTEGQLVMFWWAALGAVATALEGMFVVDQNQNGTTTTVVVRRSAHAYAYAYPEPMPQNDGSWKGTPTPTVTVVEVPGTTQMPAPQQQEKEVYKKSQTSKNRVVGSVACSALVGVASTAIWAVACWKSIKI